MDQRIWRATKACSGVQFGSSGTLPPVTIKGRRYLDGGARSGTNADLAKGYDVVVVIAVSGDAMPEVFRIPLRENFGCFGNRAAAWN